MTWGKVSVHKVGDKTGPGIPCYCGRNRPGPRNMLPAGLGNPYPVNHERTRKMSIAAFKAELDAGVSARSEGWLRAIAWMKYELEKGSNILLFCHCKPKACHCDVIKERLEQL